MSKRSQPPSHEIAVHARTLAGELRSNGASYASIAAAIHERLGWKVTKSSVHQWFDKNGNITPLKDGAPQVVMDKAALDLMEIGKIDPRTMDLAWELKKAIANELSEVAWLHAMAQSTKEPGLRMEIGNFTVPHLRAVAQIIGAVPSDAVSKTGDEDDPMAEYLRGFEG